MTSRWPAAYAPPTRLRIIEAVAATGAPVVTMTYWNPVERYGVDAFARDLAAAGGTGLITPDLIPDEAGEWLAASDAYGLDRTFLVSPSSTDARLAMTVEHCRGFVYATAIMGVTGARAQTSDAAPRWSPGHARGHRPAVGVGLGVGTGAQAATVAGYADGVIVGSALVRCLLDAPDLDAGLAALRTLAADSPRASAPAAADAPVSAADRGDACMRRRAAVACAPVTRLAASRPCPAPHGRLAARAGCRIRAYALCIIARHRRRPAGSPSVGCASAASPPARSSTSRSGRCRPASSAPGSTT